ncbi:MAG: class A beta-lactamase-related serine hydrolase [Thermoanaerobacteraceae bacterium]|nr:class A beta-lactamase-related serine hydrolase [Thermoanaerobacteraceae bacterium]
MLKENIERYIQESDIDASIYIKSMRGNFEFKYKETRVMPSASLIKLPMMAYIYKLAYEDKLDMEQKLSPRRHQIVSGSGIVKNLHADMGYSIRDLTYLMITVSDNTAANILIDYLGMDRINEEIEKLEMKDTVLKRHMMDFAARAAGIDNLTTVQDMAVFFEKLYNGDVVNYLASREMLEILKDQRFRVMNYYLPERFKAAHKTGSLDGYEHDCGIIFSQEDDMIICVMTSGFKNDYEGIDYIKGLIKTMYKE